MWALSYTVQILLRTERFQLPDMPSRLGNLWISIIYHFIHEFIRSIHLHWLDNSIRILRHSWGILIVVFLVRGLILIIVRILLRLQR